jgi:hypothetical protein
MRSLERSDFFLAATTSILALAMLWVIFGF